MIACAAGALYFCMPVEKHGLHRELRYTDALIRNTVDGECQWGREAGGTANGATMESVCWEEVCAKSCVKRVSKYAHR